MSVEQSAFCCQINPDIISRYYVTPVRPDDSDQENCIYRFAERALIAVCFLELISKRV